MVAKEATAKERIVALLDDLPAEALAEVASFIEFQRYKLRRRVDLASRPRPVKLEGLSSGANISEEEIADLRREMWGGIEDRFA